MEATPLALRDFFPPLQFAGGQVFSDDAQRGRIYSEHWQRPQDDLGGAALGHNWKPKVVDLTHLTINSGSVNSISATIGGVPLTDDPPPQLLVDDVDLNYICLKIVHTLSITSGRINSMAISAREVEANTTGLPSSTSTEKYYLLFTWQAGRLVAQNAYDNFGMEARDDGTSTSTPDYRTWRSSV